MKSFEQAKRCRAGRKEIKNYNISTEQEWNQWVEETRGYWSDMETACDIAQCDGLSIEDIEDLIL